MHISFLIQREVFRTALNSFTNLNNIFAVMCGIAGIFHFSGKPVEVEAIRKMNDIAQHRGPDDEGFLLINSKSGLVQSLIGEQSNAQLNSRYPQIKNFQNHSYNLGIAFRRLAIVDLSIAGHQPMSDDTGRYWMTFNGEIYNYVEIRNELESYGYKFSSQSDSEVLLKAYIHWGEECVMRCIGMFAIVIWDGVKQQLFGARDRFGVKPLNYYIDAEKFVWSSEEKQIIASGLVPFSANRNSIHRFFCINQLHDGEETFIEGIKRIPGAHYFILKDRKIQLKKYWELDALKDSSALNQQERIDQFKNLFEDSIRLRLRSDVPIGIALSGGLDSSSIAMMSKKLISNHIKTFSVYYDKDKKYDEREYIQAILETEGFVPKFYTQDAQININTIKKWVLHQDGPTSGASPYSAYLNYKNVRNAGIIVLLNGQGGDETLGGYPYYFKYLVADQLKSFDWIKLFRNLRQWSNDQSFSHSAKHLIGGIIKLLANQNYLIEKETDKYFTQELYSFNEYYPIKTKFNEKFNSHLKQSLYDTLKIRMLPHLLHWEDRNSMACSIESRVPFLDHRLVEYLFSLPDEEKISHGTSKVILRKAMKGIVPEKILNRRDKKGFGTPTDDWTHGELGKDIKELIYSKSMKERGIWNMDKVEKAFEQNTFGENEMWKILTTELFFQEFEKLNQ